MAKFISDSSVNAEIEKLLKESENQLVLISPFIQIHERLKYFLNQKLELPNLEILIVFGKNEDNVSKSLSKDDLEFLKRFPNIEIRYNKRLHAKYYSNENSAIITSMNLHTFSQNNNIEVGIVFSSFDIDILTEKLTKLPFNKDSFDVEASKYFVDVIKQSELIFQRKPEFSKGILGFRKKYITSKTIIDNSDKYFSYLTNSTKFEKKENYSYSNKKGFCIRTGVEIPFNINKPLCDEAYKSWSRFGNENYEENFCHFSGEESFGATSYASPILNKNYYKAKKEFNI